MILLVALLLALDLASVKSEPNLERRADLAIDFATQALKAARDAETAGEPAKVREHLAEIESAVVICKESLDGTGKNARRSPKHFKRAELRIRELLRKLKGFSEQAAMDERESIDATHSKVSAIHTQILEEIMMKK